MICLRQKCTELIAGLLELHMGSPWYKQEGRDSARPSCIGYSHMNDMVIALSPVTAETTKTKGHLMLVYSNLAYR